MTNHTEAPLDEPTTEELAATNVAMYQAHVEILSRIMARDPGLGLYELDTSAKFVARSALRLLRKTQSIGQQVYTPDGPLVVATIHDTGLHPSYTLTEDGKRYEGDWHTGSEADVLPVRVERWSTKGREFHGWIHPTSRKLVQSG